MATKMARPTRCVHMLHVSLCRWNTCEDGERAGRGGAGGSTVNGRGRGWRKGNKSSRRGRVRDDDGFGTHRAQRTHVPAPRAIPGVDVPVMHRPRGCLGPRAHVAAPSPRRRPGALAVVRALALRVRARGWDVRDGILHDGGAHVAVDGRPVAVALAPSPPRDALLGALETGTDRRARLGVDRGRRHDVWRERRWHPFVAPRVHPRTTTWTFSKMTILGIFTPVRAFSHTGKHKLVNRRYTLHVGRGPISLFIIFGGSNRVI